MQFISEENKKDSSSHLKYPRRTKRTIRGKTFFLNPPDDERSKLMQTIKSSDTEPEQIVEKELRLNKINFTKHDLIIGKIEGKINWNDKALSILGKINGLFPTPGAFFNFNGERYKILKAEIGNGLGEIGEVLSDKLEIACGNNNSIKILEIQRQGKKPQKIGEFMLGSQIKKGSKLSNV